jgi:hypothetical protein
MSYCSIILSSKIVLITFIIMDIALVMIGSELIEDLNLSKIKGDEIGYSIYSNSDSAKANKFSMGSYELISYVFGVMAIKLILLSIVVHRSVFERLDEVKLILNLLLIRSVASYNLIATTSSGVIEPEIFAININRYIFVGSYLFSIGAMAIGLLIFEGFKNGREYLSLIRNNKEIMFLILNLIALLIIYIGKVNLLSRSLTSIIETRGPGLLSITYWTFASYGVTLLEWSYFNQKRISTNETLGSGDGEIADSINNNHDSINNTERINDRVINPIGDNANTI